MSIKAVMKLCQQVQLKLTINFLMMKYEVQ